MLSVSWFACWKIKKCLHREYNALGLAFHLLANIKTNKYNTKIFSQMDVALQQAISGLDGLG